MRICARFNKGEALRFISHLDVQRLVQRAMRRADLPLRYSQGFNPHPLLSFATALSVGYTSEAEWMDVRLEDMVPPELFQDRLNNCLPEGLHILKALEIEETLPALTALIQKASYRISMQLSEPCTIAYLQQKVHVLLDGPIVVEKRTKAGKKMVDIRPMLLHMHISGGLPGIEAQSEFTVVVEGVLNAEGSLNIDLLLKYFLALCEREAQYSVCRTGVEFNGIEG